MQKEKMKYCQIFGGQDSLLELRDSLVLLKAAWMCGWIWCSSYVPHLELSNLLLHICCHLKKTALGITGGNGGFDKVEEADTKQTKYFSVLCSYFFVFFLFCFLFVYVFVWVCFVFLVCFFARESEAWSAAVINWTRFFVRIVFHLD